MTTKQVSVRLVVRDGQVVRAELQGVGDTGERAFERIGRSADGAGAIVRRVTGIFAAAMSGRQLARYADSWTELRSRVDLAVGAHEDGAEVMDRLGSMARRTYSDLGQTVESWLSNATALRELGMSTSESLDYVEALNNALVVSGARAERAAQLSNVLSQAMALNSLRGQQLNTVIMNGGRVAELLAQELGTTVSGLREAGRAGQITGDVIRRALVGNLELLRREADSMPATIGDAFTLMGNAALQFVGRMDETYGISAKVAEVIILLADNIDILAAAVIALAATRIPVLIGAFVAKAAAAGTATAAVGLLTTAVTRLGVVVALAGGPWGILAAAVAGAAAYFLVFRDNAEQVPPTIESVRAAQDQLNTALGTFANDRSREAGRAAIDLARNYEQTALAALAAAEAQIAFNEARLQGISTEALDAMAAQPGWESNPMRGVLAQLETARRDAEEARLALDGARRTLGALTLEYHQSGTVGATALGEVVVAAETVTRTLARAGQAGRLAGSQVSDGAQEAARGWNLVIDILGKYTEQSMDLAANLGSALVNAFRGAEEALAEFVRTGKLDFRSLATSIIVDLARVAQQRWILGPLSQALGGLLGRFGGGLGAGLFPLAKLPSGDGGGFTGWGARAGGLDGKGGFLAMLHPRERVVDMTRDGGRGAAPVIVNFNVRDIESFRQSQTQIAADLARAVGLGRRGQ